MYISLCGIIHIRSFSQSVHIARQVESVDPFASQLVQNMAGKGPADLKATAAAAIDGYKDELQELGSQIWENPELGFEEVKAHKILTDFLENKGFKVDRSYTIRNLARETTIRNSGPHSGPPSALVDPICALYASTTPYPI